MRIGRAIIIPIIVTLGVAGSSMAGAATAVAALNTSNISAIAHVSAAGPDVFFHS
jgi:hypothetical protein